MAVVVTVARLNMKNSALTLPKHIRVLQEEGEKGQACSTNRCVGAINGWLHPEVGAIPQTRVH
jgi:hypothetical protein